MPGLSDNAFLLAAGVDVEQGWAQAITVPAPAAGAASIGRIAPGETWERIAYGRVTYTTSAVVANRLITIQFNDSLGNVWWEAPASLAVVASTSVEVSFSIDVPGVLAASGISTASVPSHILQSGFGIQFTASNVDVGDQWGVLRMWLQRFPTNAVRFGPPT